MKTNTTEGATGRTEALSRHVRRAARVVSGGSIKIRLGGRMMLLVWRTRARIAKLLHRMLARSLRQLSIGAATTVAVLGGPTAMAAPPAVNALPTGGAVVAGQAALSQMANTLNVVQTSKNAILNWNTFNIGSGATVNFQQPNATSATLNRVITNDPSALLGRLTANGKVWLINPAGIMVGKDARIDVAGFVASTLNVRDEDFLANRLNFSGGAGAGKVQNFGAITTLSGGSVYLVGAGVENQGVITAPGGEVLLAAGHSVQLIDTGTPGVKVEITGSEGTTTNLAQILSEAGRIGMAGVLVKNAGVLDASSVRAEGGRIFLQSAGSLVTEASSRLSADGATGGTITLKAETAATIDGSLSAQGLAGHGGFVETSGKTQLSVSTAPSIGLGGEWLIDPNNITIQAAGSLTNATSGPAFSSTNDNSIVTTGLIESALNAGTSVTITTSSLGSNTQAGNITVASPITKSGGLDAALTLTVNRSIFVNQSITSTSGALNLSLNANSAGGQTGSVNIASALDLNGGALNVAGPLVLNGASLSGLQLNTDSLVTFGGNTSLNTNLSVANAVISNGTLQGTGKLTATNLNWTGGTIAGAASSPAYEITNLTLTGSETLDGRTLNLVAGGVSKASNAYLTFKNSAVLNNAGTLTVADGTQLGYYYSASAGSSAINNSGTVNSANSLTSSATNTLGGSYDALNSTAFNNTGTVNVTDSTLQLGGGGTHTGGFNVSASAAGKTSTLGFGGNVYASATSRTQSINAGATFTETGSNGGVATVDLSTNSASTTDLNTDVSLANAALSWGTLQGPGKLTATNLNWSGGTIAGAAGSPAYDVTNLTLSGSALLDGRTLNLVTGGVSRAKSAYLTFKNSAVLNNAGSLTVADSTQVGYYYSLNAGSSIINNSGTINSTNTSSYSATNTLGGNYDTLNYTAFNNTGTVNVTDGTLQLGGGGTHTGAFNVSASGFGKKSTLGFGGNTYYSSAARTQNINAGATFTETGSDGGVAVVDLSNSSTSTTNLNTDVSLANAAVSGGTLQGTGKLAATSLNWSSGTIMGGAGSAAYDITDLALSGSTTLDGRSLNLVAGGVSKATSAYLTFKNGAVLNNAGDLTVADGTQLGYYYSPNAGSSAINNSGTINSANTSTYATINSLGTSFDALNFTAFSNTGTVNVTDGTLQLGGGGTHTGAFNVTASSGGKTSTLGFGGNAYYYAAGRTQNINIGATFTETGANGGIATVDLSSNSNATTNLNTNVSLVNAAVSSGTLQGTGKLTATNLNWTGGTIAGGGSSPAYDVDNLALSGSQTLDGRILNLLAGGVSRASSDYLSFKNSAVLNNAGALTVADGTQLGYYTSPSAGSSAINNSGTVNSTNTSIYSTTNTLGGNYDALNATAFNNTGTVNVTDGTLQLSGSGAHTGAFNVSASTSGKTSTLGFGGNTYYYAGAAARTQNINAGATFTETATNGGVSTVVFSDSYYNSNGAINLNTNVSLANAAISSGTLQGTGKLTATNLNWSGGTIAGAASGPAYDVTNLTLSGSETLDGRTINLLAGGASRASGAYLTFKNSAVLNNAGTLTVADGSQLGYYYSPNAGSSAINNSGTVNSTNRAIYSTINTLGGSYDASNFTAFSNSGTVNVTDGTLQLSGGGTHTGAFNVNASGPGKTSTLGFGSNTYYYYNAAARTQNINPGATFTETATNGGVSTVVFTDYYNNNGEINLNTDVSLANATLSGGMLQGTGKLTATNLNWSGGTIAGGANNPAYDITNLILSGSETLDGRTLNLVADGVSKARSAYLTLKNSAVLNNFGTLTVADGTQLGYYTSPTAGSSTINNRGTINITNTSDGWTTNTLGGNYNTLNFTAFNNLSIVNVTDGTLQLGGGTLVNNGQIRVGAGTTLSTASRDLTNSPSGVLSGNGTVNLGGSSTLINNGVVAPGTPEATGTLTLTGNYTQGSTGNLVARIGGVASNQHDLLQVSGNVKLDGALTATALNNYVAVASDAVTLIGGTPQTSTVSGTFRIVSTPSNLHAGYGLFSGAPFRLTYAPGGSVFFSNDGGDFSWSNPLNWSSRSLPVLGSDVQINAGYTVQHDSGNDAISSLTINQNNGLNVSGGTISIANLTRIDGKLAVVGSGSASLNGGLSGSGLLTVGGGTVNLKGVSGIANLELTSGVVTGDSNFTVSNSFSQTGGSLNFQTAAVDLRQNTGDLVIGNLSAASARLQSVSGAILEGQPATNADSLSTQSSASAILEAPASITVNALTTRSARGTRLDSGANAIGALAATNTESGNVLVTTTGSLSVSQISDVSGTVTINAGDAISQTGGITAAALRTSSGTGTRLDGTNAVSSFSAANASSGDIVFVNTTRPGTLTVLGVNNNGGGVMIDNTGAILTSGDITAAQGALSLTAHSPITVSSALAARDGITLNALPSSLALDTISINGTLASATGNIALVAGTSALVAGSASFTVSSGSGISLSALAGDVSVLPGATFVGATPTITQRAPTSISPPVSTPAPIVAPAPAPMPATPGLTPEIAPLAGAPVATPTTIDSIQKTTAPFETAARNPALLSIVDAGGATGFSSGYPVERQTIGGGVDSFGGVASPERSAGDSDNTGGAPGKAAGTEANRPAKSLPVCS
jgi:filamentous hemagglutinin family protein